MHHDATAHSACVCVCLACVFVCGKILLWCGGGEVCSLRRPTFGQNNTYPHTCTSMVSMLCHSPSHFLSTLYVLPSTHKTAFCNMLRVLALTNVGCLGLTVAFAPVCPVYTLHAAKCQVAQTNVHLLLGRLGCGSGTLHVCHAVSTTSGGSSNSSEEYGGVSKDVAGNAWEGRSNVFSWLMYPSAFPQT